MSPADLTPNAAPDGLPDHPLPRRRLLQIGAALAAASAAVALPALAQAQAASAPAKPKVVDGYTELRWDDLVPKGWDPSKTMRDKGITNIGMLNDGDPKTQTLMNQMREAWDNAPTEPSLDGAKVRLPGYLVPLEETAAGHTEFLLVPYFGACIHTPPPPANQIVMVVPAKPAAGFRSMDTVWVNGVLKAARSNTAMGSSGYRLESALVERYKATPR
jgi:uncharacterized protein